MDLKDCPITLKLLFKCGMNYDPRKRPAMKFIFEIFKKLNSVINKNPIKQLIKNSEIDISLDGFQFS